jgi:hypothetical protein
MTRRYDAGVRSADRRQPRASRCPRCRAPVHWGRNPHRPFCSLACRLIDLGEWLDERYRIAGQPLPVEASGHADTAQDSR